MIVLGVVVAIVLVLVFVLLAFGEDIFKSKYNR